MPEGPLLILYKESLSALIGDRIEGAGTTRRNAALENLEGCILTGIHTWGKYLFLLFDDGVLHLRIHWGMFGIWYLDEPRPGKEPTAILTFHSGQVLYLYSVSMRIAAGIPSSEDYDPRADVMSQSWDSSLALNKLRALPGETMVCDALLDQTIFAGLGNAIKTEALFACLVHPESRVAELPAKLLKALVTEAIGQSHLFLEERSATPGERYGWVLAYRKKV